MVTLALAAVFGVILYRMSMVAALNVVDEETIKGNASLFISATGALINLVCILVFNQVVNIILHLKQVTFSWCSKLDLD